MTTKRSAATTATKRAPATGKRHVFGRVLAGLIHVALSYVVLLVLITLTAPQSLEQKVRDAVYEAQLDLIKERWLLAQTGEEGSVSPSLPTSPVPLPAQTVIVIGQVTGFTSDGSPVFVESTSPSWENYAIRATNPAVSPTFSYLFDEETDRFYFTD